MFTFSPENYIGNSKKPTRTFDPDEAMLIGDLKSWVEQNNELNEYTNIGRLVKILQKAKHKQNFEILTSKVNKNQFVIIGNFNDGFEDEREKIKEKKSKKK
jgi:hypothetical protein